MRHRAIARVLAAATIWGAAVDHGKAATVVLNAATNVVQLDSSTSGKNDAVSLVDSVGPVTIQASGNASFGSQPGEVYNAAVAVYQDAANLMQYAAVPMNGSATISGSHYTFALITDSAGAV